LIILVDAMGGDNAPHAVVTGCMDAIIEQSDFEVILIGDSQKINNILNERGFSNDRLKVHHAPDVISNEDSPVKAIKSKKESSMVVGLNMIKKKEGDVFLSAGNTGALMTGAMLILGRIKGVVRPALTTYLPSKKGLIVLMDAGANTNCKPINLLQYGFMGSIFLSEVFGIKKPKVGLLNVGTEENKGNDLTKNAFPLLKSSDINFVGNIEGRNVMDGDADVLVCDGFVGNILLKALEGAAEFFVGSIKAIFLKNLLNKIAALVIKGEFKKFMKELDYTEYGGVPLLGVNGKVIKSHGSSNAKAIKNAVLKAILYAKSNVLEQIREEFKNMEVDDVE